jgi:hypothetical protein
VVIKMASLTCHRASKPVAQRIVPSPIDGCETFQILALDVRRRKLGMPHRLALSLLRLASLAATMARCDSSRCQRRRLSETTNAIGSSPV